MRYTLKAKLATVFGAIVVAFVVTGTVAYLKLETLAEVSRSLVSRGGRIIAATQMRSSFLREISAEKDNDMSVSDDDVVKYVAETRKLRAEVIAKIGEIELIADDAGKEMMKGLREDMEKRAKVEEQILQGGIANSNNRANAYWSADGEAALKAAVAALDASVATLDKGKLAPEAVKAAADLREVKYLFQRISTLLALTFSAGSEKDLADQLAVIKEFSATTAQSFQHALAESAPLGVSAAALSDAVNTLVKAQAHTVEVVAGAGNLKAISQSWGEGRTVSQKVMDGMNAYVEHVRADMLSDTAEADRAAALAQNILLGAVAATLLLAAAGGAWIALNLSRSVARASALAEGVANGDLTQKIEAAGDDELGDLVRTLDDMASKLRATVSEALNASHGVASGSEELSASANQLSHGATEQAAATEQASSAMEEIAANVKQNAENAGQTEKIARASADAASQGGAAVSRAVKAMETIAGKITIVQEIARQTDLLALNAAVEAARAGEHGRGFAVVASEVRKLAERSQAAAAEISTLSADTVRTAQDAGAMLERLVPEIRRTADLIGEISSACREQDIGVSQINGAIQKLDQVTQQNAASSEEVSATSQELSSQAERLQSTISFFRIDNGEGPVKQAVKRLKGKAAAMRAKEVGKPQKAKAPTAKSVGGFALELADGDEMDHDFRRTGS